MFLTFLQQPVRDEAIEMTSTHQQGSKWDTGVQVQRLSRIPSTNIEATVKAQSQHTNSRVLLPVPELLKNMTQAFNACAFGVRFRLAKVKFTAFLIL